MPKWKRQEKLYTVKLTYHNTRGTQLYLPKPIVEQLGRPDRVSFLMNEGEVLLMPAKRAYIVKALETLDSYSRRRISKKEAVRIFMDISTEPIVEEDEVLDDIFTDLIMLDEPEGRGKPTQEDIDNLKRRLRTILGQ